MIILQDIPVYSSDGVLVSSVHLPESVILSEKRTSKSSTSDIFYKGSGVIYTKHSVWDTDGARKQEFSDIESSSVFYISYTGCKNVFRGKTGIFMERFQPYFSDFIGGCGKKEENLIYTCRSIDKKVLGIELLDVIETPIKDHSVYKCKYHDNRKNNLPSVRNLVCLIEFISNGEWYCPWDKNLIEDIDSRGRIHDPSDWKHCPLEFSNESYYRSLGTLYSLLYSLSKKSISLLRDLLSHYSIPLDEKSIRRLLPLFCVVILHKSNFSYIPPECKFSTYSEKEYRIIMKGIIEYCSPCCCLETDEFSWAKEEYKRQIFLCEK